MSTYWYNVGTGQVEEDVDRSRMDELMGPYNSREEAQAALTKAHERTEAWDEEDRRENEDGGGSLLG